MDALFASGRIVDLVLLLIGIEVLLLWTWRRGGGRAPALFHLLPNLAAGACLLCALRAGLTGAAWPVVAAWLTAGLAGHLADLWLRWPACDRSSRRG